MSGCGEEGPPDARPAHARRAETLERALGAAADLLPAQGPISIFVHHNTLHTFESEPFEAAVVRAGEILGCEPFLAVERYREELAQGRIREEDLTAVVEAELGAAAREPVAGRTTRLELYLALLRGSLERPAGVELEWMLAETDVLSGAGAPRAERRAARARLEVLWTTCLRAGSGRPVAVLPRPPLLRHRDLLLAATGADTDALVHPLLIRVCAAYLDQGLAYWPMPRRELGLYRCFRTLYRRPAGPPSTFARTLARQLAVQEAAGAGALEAALEGLDALGVPEPEWEDYVRASLLALRGWAGMIRQIETRPDRVPVHAPPAALLDFLAVRLTAERCALADTARRHLGFREPLAGLRSRLGTQLVRCDREAPQEAAFTLFRLSRILGLSTAELDAPKLADALLDEVDALPERERRRLLQLAYERRYRVELLGALEAAATRPIPWPEAPRLQALFCIDEREESLRRHLEEVEPDCETLGYAGFFGVAMYYRGAADARPVPLCPVVVRPEHEVEELVVDELRDAARRRTRLRRGLGHLGRALHVGSRTFTRGALLSALLGTLAAFPLVFRVLFPRNTARLRRGAGRLIRPPARTRLALDQRPGVQPLLGARAGFAVDEMAAIVAQVLEDTGLGGRLAPLVLVVGHGSSSLNNPHESAHDCGACGGGRGGPNARAFACMANDPRVRERLAARGCAIPDGTLFVGAYHDSCDDAIRYFDQEAVPQTHRAEIAAARAALDQARARNAAERCRRLAPFLARPSPSRALAHVEARAADLAQPRPEYGHATNAACIVGRRARTRGLFLDRRVFLASYDPERDDPEGRILERLLAAVAPVCAGINLEYYFSTVDPHGYGCHTKLPHNIVSLLGVMDGQASDLRTGLPWQMVEIHEPVRLLLVVESKPERMRAVLGRNAALDRMVRNGWIQLATLAPRNGGLHVFEPRRCRFGTWNVAPIELPVAVSSAAWHGGRRGALPFACIETPARPAGGTA